MKRILVTGDARYKGCGVVPKLLRAGYEVLVYDLRTFGSGICPRGPVVDRPGGDAALAIAAPCAAVETPSKVLRFTAGCVGARAIATVGNRAAIECTSLAGMNVS